MEIKFTPQPLEYFKEQAKKAAHKYAMHVVASPLAHKQAVLDIEQSFYAGAMTYREIMDNHKRTCEILPSLDVICQQAFEKLSSSYFGDHQNDDFKKSIKTDVEKGVSWAIQNYSKGDSYGICNQ